MKYLVTGGAGFIGSHITETLLKAGHSVVIIDNLSTGERERVAPGAHFVEADMTNLESIKSHFAGVDGVFHCAALPRVVFSIEDPLTSHQANINGTLNVLLAARDAGVKRFVYSASSSAYGGSEVLPLHEELLPQPLSPYGLQKYVGEHYTRLFALLYGMETVSLRYFNVYGPRMALRGGYVTVIAMFLKQQRLGQSLTIAGDGEQTRDFTYIGDIVNANISAMTSDRVGKGEVINIGGNHNYSINEIAQKFIALTQVKAIFQNQDHSLYGTLDVSLPIEHIAPRIEPRNSLADVSRAQDLLGWNPKVSLEVGLAKTIEWFKTVTEDKF
jgi:nucleoside-diphosphate-sugar epimerase